MTDNQRTQQVDNGGGSQRFRLNSLDWVVAGWFVVKGWFVEVSQYGIENAIPAIKANMPGLSGQLIGWAAFGALVLIVRVCRDNTGEKISPVFGVTPPPSLIPSQHIADLPNSSENPNSSV